MRFFKMDREVLNEGLSPKALFVYAYLTSKSNVFRQVAAGYSDIAAACNMTAKTAITAVSELCERGLLVKYNRYNSTGYKKNGYYIAKAAKSTGWVAVEYDVFQSAITSTDFAVYLYVKSCMGYDRKSRKNVAFPSLTRIAGATRISRARVVAAVQYLRSHSFFNCLRRRYKATKAFFISSYTAITLKNAQKKVRFGERTFQKYYIFDYLNYKYIIPFCTGKVKGRINQLCSFLWKGGIKFTQQLLDTINTTIKREKHKDTFS